MIPDLYVPLSSILNYHNPLSNEPYYGHSTRNGAYVVPRE